MSRSPRPAPRAGLYEDDYWRFAAAGELRLQRCSDCARFRYPPGATCPRCLSSRFSWEPLSGHGTLIAWTTFHRQYFPELPPGYVVASVATDEGPLLVGNLVGVRDPAHGMRLAATAEPVLLGGQSGQIWQWTTDPEPPTTHPGEQPC